jgi:hypothetical protein
VGHTFEELVAKQRAVAEAHARVVQLRDSFGPPTQEGGWNENQTETYETAWRAWRDLDRDVRATVAEFAKTEGRSRQEVEAELERAVAEPGDD